MCDPKYTPWYNCDPKYTPFHWYVLCIRLHTIPLTYIHGVVELLFEIHNIMLTYVHDRWY